MMETKQITFMAVTLFIGLFQFFTSRMIIKNGGKTKRIITQNYYVKQWGRTSLLYSGFMMPFYYLSPDKILYIVLIYVGLLMYNVYLLKKGIRKVNTYYPASDPDGERSLSTKNDDIAK